MLCKCNRDLIYFLKEILNLVTLFSFYFQYPIFCFWCFLVPYLLIFYFIFWVCLVSTFFIHQFQFRIFLILCFWGVVFGAGFLRYFLFFILFHGFFFLSWYLFLINCFFLSVSSWYFLFLTFKSLLHLANNLSFFSVHSMAFFVLGLQWTFINCTWMYKVSG